MKVSDYLKQKGYDLSSKNREYGLNAKSFDQDRFGKPAELTNEQIYFVLHENRVNKWFRSKGFVVDVPGEEAIETTVTEAPQNIERVGADSKDALEVRFQHELKQVYMNNLMIAGFSSLIVTGFIYMIFGN